MPVVRDTVAHAGFKITKVTFKHNLKMASMSEERGCAPTFVAASSSATSSSASALPAYNSVP